jgi:hypothetical protein
MDFIQLSQDKVQWQAFVNIKWTFVFQGGREFFDKLSDL